MRKLFFGSILTILLTACQEKNEDYFWQNFDETQKTLQQCPAVQPELITCKRLQEIANNMQAFANELRLSPQGFGKSILALEEKIAAQEISLKENPNQPALQSSLQRNKQQLTQRLAIVKRYESPES